MHVLNRLFFFIITLSHGIFAKLPQNMKSTTKLTYVFLEFFLSYSPHKFTLFTKMPLAFFFLSEMTFLLSQLHHLHVFTRLSLSSIHQPP